MIIPNTIEDLLIDFDELNFVPINTIPFDPDEYAKAWKKSLIKAIEDERKETAREIATRIKAKVDEISSCGLVEEYVTVFNKHINDVVNEYVEEVTNG